MVRNEIDRSYRFGAGLEGLRLLLHLVQEVSGVADEHQHASCKRKRAARGGAGGEVLGSKGKEVWAVSNLNKPPEIHSQPSLKQTKVPCTVSGLKSKLASCSVLVQGGGL